MPSSYNPSLQSEPNHACASAGSRYIQCSYRTGLDFIGFYCKEHTISRSIVIDKQIQWAACLSQLLALAASKSRLARPASRDQSWQHTSERSCPTCQQPWVRSRAGSSTVFSLSRRFQEHVIYGLLEGARKRAKKRAATMPARLSAEVRSALYASMAASKSASMRLSGL